MRVCIVLSVRDMGVISQQNQTQSATVVPTALEHDNFELRTRAYVRRVLYDSGNQQATGVMYVDEETGEEFEQPADVVVLSAFAFTITVY